MLLAGDIGGTNARLALFDDALRPVRWETTPTAGQSNLRDIIDRFLVLGRFNIHGACVGIAGVVGPSTVTGPNLPWSVDVHELERTFPFPIRFVNDLEANARGIEALGPRDFALVGRGDPQARGTRAVVSAGTGLGEAGLVWDGEHYRVVAGEGGHADFAPRSELEIGLYRHLAAMYGHVSYERVCSGAGLAEIYRFLRGPEHGPAPDPALISAEAAVDPRSIAARALDLFASIYGARAGNVALAFKATGGVYLGGGIAPRMVRRLQAGPFMRAFADKGRLSPLMRRIPVHVVLNDRTALLGAARIAAELRGTRHLSAAA
jgi:glucokinase